MNDFIRLTCPACGGKLEITHTINQFACAHCGTEHLVNRGGGTISLQPLVEGLQRIQCGTDYTAAELAIQRLRAELSELKAEQEQYKQEVQETYGEITKLSEWKKEFGRTKQTRLIFAIGSLVAGILLLLIGWSAQLPICTGIAFIELGAAAVFAWQNRNLKINNLQDQDIDEAMEIQHDYLETLQKELSQLRREISDVTAQLEKQLDIVRRQ